MRKPLIMLVVLLGTALAVAPVASTQELQVRPVLQEHAYSAAELEQLLAPIALYPDVLLSTVLIAATYPLEIVQAARWSRENPGLRGEAAVAAVNDRDWDPAVQALVAFPDVLDQLDAALDWTQALGDAFLIQEGDVMDAVQLLRLRAADTGHLRSDEHVRVVRTERTVIVEPVRERVVYVPWVDPLVVYGPWWHPYHPPVRWHTPVHYRPARTGLYWSSGFVVSSGFFFTQVAWPQRHVVVVHTPVYVYPSHRRPRPVHYVPGKRWRHEPRHRRGVAYVHPEVHQRYAASPRVRANTRVTAPSPQARTRATPPATAWAPSARRQATERAPGGARITGAPARPGAEAAVRDHARSRQRRETVAEAPVSRLAAPPARGQVTPDRSTQPLRSTPQQTRRAPEARTPVQAPAPQPRTRAQTHTRGTAPAVGARASAPPASSPGPAPRESTARETTQRGTSQRQATPRQATPRQATPRQATPRLGAPARDAGSARGRSAERGRGGGRREVD